VFCACPFAIVKKAEDSVKKDVEWYAKYNAKLTEMLTDDNIDRILIQLQTLDAKNKRYIKSYVNKTKLSNWASEEINEILSSPEIRMKQLWSDDQETCNMIVGRWSTTSFHNISKRWCKYSSFSKNLSLIFLHF